MAYIIKSGFNRLQDQRGRVSPALLKAFFSFAIPVAIVLVFVLSLHFFPQDTPPKTVATTVSQSMEGKQAQTTHLLLPTALGVLLGLIAIVYLIFRIFGKKEVVDFTDILKKIGSLHVVRMFVLLLLSYLIVMGISKDFFDTIYGNTLLFWVVTIGALFVVAVFKIEQPRALIITLVVVFSLHEAGILWNPLRLHQKALEASAQQSQVVKNIVMGLPVSPLEIEIPVAPRMLIINPGVTKGLLCYNNDLSIKMYHLSSQGSVVALFENVKGQEMREKGWKFPVLQSGGSLGFQAQGEKSVTAKMWLVPRGESCD
mgnify:CR=1 FL=1